MSIYNSDATSSSFSILGNTTPSTSSRSSRGSRGGRSGRSSNLLNTSAQIGSGTPGEAPNVVGLSRISAINALIASGINYSVSYTFYGANKYNNDKVSSQTVVDLVVVIDVYQYTSTPWDNLKVFELPLSNFANKTVTPIAGSPGYATWELRNPTSMPQELLSFLSGPDGVNALLGRSISYEYTGTLLSGFRFYVSSVNGTPDNLYGTYQINGLSNDNIEALITTTPLSGYFSLFPTELPNVNGLNDDSARQTLYASGFKPLYS